MHSPSDVCTDSVCSVCQEFKWGTVLERDDGEPKTHLRFDPTTSEDEFMELCVRAGQSVQILESVCTPAVAATAEHEALESCEFLCVRLSANARRKGWIKAKYVAQTPSPPHVVCTLTGKRKGKRKRANESEASDGNDFEVDDQSNGEESDGDSDDELEDEMFIVEEISAHKSSGNTCSYHVKWEGYAELTWEPEANLSCNTVLMAYKAKYGL